MNQVSSNARWLAVAQIMRVSVQLLSVTILARLLKPEYYGIVALSASVMAFINLFKDLGIGASLVQTEHLTNEHKNTAFVMSFLMSILLFVTVLLIASPMANYYEQPQLKWVLIIIAIGFPFNSLAVVPISLMEREGRFKQVAVIETINNVTAFIITLTMALSGMGVYSLVIPSLLVLPLYLFLLFRANDWRPSFKASFKSIQAMIGFSANLTGFNLINFFSRNLDVFIVGKLLGVVALGLYSTSTKLMLMPLQTVTYVSNRALFPVLSQQKNNIELFRETYFSAMSYVALITFPMMFGLWVTRESFVNAIYGPKWLGLINLLYWMALTGVIQSVNSTTGTVYMAQGKTNLLFKLGIFSATLQTASFFVGAQAGIETLCKLYFISNILACMSSFYFVVQITESNLQYLFKRLKPALISSFFMIGAASLSKFFMPESCSDIQLLICQTLVGAITYALSLRFLFNQSWQALINSLNIKAFR